MSGVAPHEFDLSGGALCLAFVNTLGDRPRSAEEHLRTWSDFVAWGEQAHLLSTREAAAERSRANAHPVVAQRAFSAAIEFREQLYRALAAIAAGRTPPRDDFSGINALLGSALSHACVEMRDGGFVWGWTGGKGPFDLVLWPVVRSAGDLFVSPERAAIRECASDTCSWLFLDRSRAHRRRWCSMKGCGNRDKVRRFHARRRAALSAASAAE